MIVAQQVHTEASTLFGMPEWLVMVIILVLVAMIALGFGMLKGRRIKAEKERAATASDADLARHHTPRWSVDFRSFQAEPRHWGLAIAAPFALCAGEDWDRLRHRDVDEVRTGLTEAWGVYSRETMLSTLYDMLTAGHRTRFGAEVTDWAAMGAQQAEAFEQSMRKAAAARDDAAERLWSFRRVRANDRGLRSVDFTAWDLVRCAMLARAGATAGYLSDAEAEDALLLIAEGVRRRYRSWAELGESFVVGRWFWNAQGGEAEKQMDRHDLSRQQALLAANGPWRFVPWGMELPASRMLFADAFAEFGSVRLNEKVAEPWAARLNERLRTSAD